jgi:ActR/RegA family two-component response regulator
MSMRYVFEVLMRVGDNKSRAARLLGVDRRTLGRILARARTGRCPSMHTRA